MRVEDKVHGEYDWIENWVECMIKKDAGKRGFVASLDAVFSLLLAILFVTMILSVIRDVPDLPSFQLQREAMDVLTVLEHRDSFYSPDTTLAETSDSICARLELHAGAGGTIAAQFVKPGCPLSDSEERMSWRSFFNGSQMMTAKLVVWVKDNPLTGD